MRAGESGHLLRADAHAFPGVVLLCRGWKSIDLAVHDAARFERAARFGEIRKHHIAAGNVLKHGVGVDEIEELIFVAGEVCPIRGAWERVGDVCQVHAGQADHFIGNIHAMDLAEVPAHRPH